jgi:hypothetical protein
VTRGPSGNPTSATADLAIDFRVQVFDAVEVEETTAEERADRWSVKLADRKDR